MKSYENLMRLAIGGLVAAGAVGTATPAMAGDTAGMEQCAGLVKAGKNDCATSTNQCHGHVASDRNPEAWIYVPAGTCERLVGGHVVNVKDPTPR
jgi:uncharacterized membrane protein